MHRWLAFSMAEQKKNVCSPLQCRCRSLVAACLKWKGRLASVTKDSVHCAITHGIGYSWPGMRVKCIQYNADSLLGGIRARLDFDEKNTFTLFLLCTVTAQAATRVRVNDRSVKCIICVTTSCMGKTAGTNLSTCSVLACECTSSTLSSQANSDYDIAERLLKSSKATPCAGYKYNCSKTIIMVATDSLLPQASAILD